MSSSNKSQLASDGAVQTVHYLFEDDGEILEVEIEAPEDMKPSPASALAGVTHGESTASSNSSNSFGLSYSKISTSIDGDDLQSRKDAADADQLEVLRSDMLGHGASQALPPFTYWSTPYSSTLAQGANDDSPWDSAPLLNPQFEAVARQAGLSVYNPPPRKNNGSSKGVVKRKGGGVKRVRERQSPTSPEGGEWRNVEDKVLKRAINAIGSEDWERISLEYFEGDRTANECKNRWHTVLGSSMVKGPWTPKEDEAIKCCIDTGMTKWSEIAEFVPGRVSKQCRERWYNHLDPTLKKGDWTEAEDTIIINAQAEWGNAWSRIARMLPNRSENAVKNRWNSSTMKRIIQSRLGADSNEAGSHCLPLTSLRYNL